ncbi:MAG: lamin tail domain-containing protein, partial [Planctomycetales bacterium]|nr:lamin tail domain-containing protein [Planctomycetales bacterium]
DGFKFFEHDSEHSLDTGNAAGANYDMVNPLTTGGSQFQYFNPHWMHEQLARLNTEYRQRFADRVYEVFFNDGLLTPDNAKAIVDARAAQIDQAIIAESARWGDAKRGTPFNKNDWLGAVNSIRSFIDNRIPTVLNQLRGQNWYPDTEAPLFTVNGSPIHSGRIDDDDLISMVTTSSTVFTAIVEDGSSWKYLDNGSNQGTAWRQPSFNDASWQSGNAQLGYGDGDEVTVVSYGSNANDKYPTTYFRKSFNVADKSAFQTLQLRLQRDDGAVVYLNGKEVVRSNMPGGTISYDTYAAGVAGGGDETTFFEYAIDLNDLVNGTNVLAVEVHQTSGSSSDISFDLELLGGSLVATNGTVYYTLDGSDPRLPGGQINPNATLFNGQAFALPGTRIIHARSRINGQWSPLATATYSIDEPAAAGNLTITEINYNPHDALTQFGDLDVDNDDFEFVELANIGDTTIDLTGVRFIQADNDGSTEGIEFDFATQTLDPGQRMVVVKDRVAFASRYGTNVRIAEALDQVDGVYAGGLSNGGELLTLVDAAGDVIVQFEYNDSGAWPGRADGRASTLELKEDMLADLADGNSWRSSNEFGGSPGAAGTGPIRDIVINEILTHTDLPQVDMMELHNVSNQTVPIANWYISDNNDNYFEHQISFFEPAMTAGSYRTLDENQLGFGFRGQESDDLHIVAATVNGKPLRFVDDVDFGAAQNGVSLGRWPNGSGELFPMTSLTLGQPNSGPRLGNVLIGEVHYHPVVPNGATLAESELEFVEVWNPSGSPLNIGHWRLNKAIDFEFAANTVIGVGERLTVVSFDPVAEPAKASDFRSIYGMNQNARLLGPFSGGLDNGGERLELDRPEDLAQLGLGYVLVDRILYNDDSPWPATPDGGGSSLHRTDAQAFGDLATGWAARTPTPGQDGGTGNGRPNAANDVYSVAEGGLLTISAPGVLSNDSDPNGDALTASLLSQPDFGTLALNANGSFTYQHNGGEQTQDSFVYQVSDGQAVATATVTINITPVNDRPVGRGDSYAVNEGSVLRIPAPGLLTNDSDVDSSSLTAV